MAFQVRQSPGRKLERKQVVVASRHDGFGTALKRALNPTFMDAARQPAVIRLLIESGADFERLTDDERKLLAQALKGV